MGHLSRDVLAGTCVRESSGCRWLLLRFLSPARAGSRTRWRPHRDWRPTRAPRTCNKTIDMDNVSFKEKTNRFFLLRLWVHGKLLHRWVFLAGQPYKTRPWLQQCSDSETEMVNCTMPRGSLEDPCTASVTTAPAKAATVLRIATGQTAEKHLSGRAGDRLPNELPDTEVKIAPGTRRSQMLPVEKHAPGGLFCDI